VADLRLLPLLLLILTLNETNLNLVLLLQRDEGVPNDGIFATLHSQRYIPTQWLLSLEMKKAHVISHDSDQMRM
jgi:hypothetical protein